MDGISTIFYSDRAIQTEISDRPAIAADGTMIQEGYCGENLSQFEHKVAPPAAAEIQWPKIDNKLAASNPFA